MVSVSTRREGQRTGGLVRRVVVVVAGIACTAVTGGGSAGALECAPHPDGSPQAIASGTEVLVPAGAFFDRYAFAAIGTVTAIETVDGDGEPNYGATTITVDVAAVLGEADVPATFALHADDPGWLNGYPYAVGTAYFVPVVEEGPDGDSNYTSLCDPITPVENVPSLVAELTSVAPPGLIRSPGAGATTSESSSTGSDGATAALWTSGGLAVVAAVGVVLWRLRRR
jgi:hypothetical protein